MSASSVKMIENCPRLWRHEYLDGNRSPSGKFALIGTAGHSVVESYLKGEIAADAIGKHPALIDVGDPLERQKVVDYARSKETKKRRLIGTEIEFLVQVAPGILPVKGYIDAAYLHPDGTVEIEDHKSNRSRETAEDWAVRIQPRLYSLVARRFLWPEAKKIRFTIGYMLLGGEVSWETDPAWDDDTVDRLVMAHESMMASEHPEVVGEHCKWCALTSTCGAYRDAIFGFRDSILTALSEKTPVDRYVELRAIEKLVKSEKEKAEESLRISLEMQGKIVHDGREWFIGETSERKAPTFSDVWKAAMGPTGHDLDAVDAIFAVADELFSVRLGGLDGLMKDHGELERRIRPIIERTPKKAVKNEPVEKIAKKSKKSASK
jgi:hypothetical protein